METTYEEDLNVSFGEEQMTYEDHLPSERDGLSHSKSGTLAPETANPLSLAPIPKEQDLARESSEATDNWDLCETSSVSSSWLDLEDEHTSLLVIDGEDVVVVKPSAAEASAEVAKPPSFAEILKQLTQPDRASVAPQLIKPGWAASRVLKTVPEHDAVEQGEQMVEDWELYKSQNAQVRSRDRRKRKGKR